MMMIYSVKYATYLSEQIFLHVNLGIVHLILRYYCLKVIVFAFMTLVFGFVTAKLNSRSCDHATIVASNRFSTINVKIV